MAIWATDAFNFFKKLNGGEKKPELEIPPPKRGFFVQFPLKIECPYRALIWSFFHLHSISGKN
ncbi:MAG: hypothetical protein EBU82_08505 [Flavobacteriia bacterium]|nr:hypothetical protein [Flavobacteriia bacterium]